MTALELIRAVEAVGASLRADPPDLVIRNPKLVPPDLKAELKARKPELLRILQPVTSPEAIRELDRKRQKLEAEGVSVAIFEDGTMKVCRTASEMKQSRKDGGVLYSPTDMYYRAQLTPDEKRTLHEFKKRYGGTIQWRPA